MFEAKFSPRELKFGTIVQGMYILLAFTND